MALGLHHLLRQVRLLDLHLAAISNRAIISKEITSKAIFSNKVTHHLDPAVGNNSNHKAGEVITITTAGTTIVEAEEGIEEGAGSM